VEVVDDREYVDEEEEEEAEEQ
jgi:hypothetical protein